MLAIALTAPIVRNTVPDRLWRQERIKYAT